MTLLIKLTILLIIICIFYILNLDYCTTERFDNLNLDNQIITYVINLKKREDRKNQIVAELQKHNIVHEIMEAVDGNNLNVDELITTGTIKYKQEHRKLRKGEIGCYFSHINVFKKFLKTDKKYCLILEDDVELVNDFKNKYLKILEELENDKINFDMLFLSTNCGAYGKIHCDGPPVTKNTYMPKQLGYGAHSYIITKESAQKLLDIAFPIYCPIDVVYDIQFETKNMKIIKSTEKLTKVREYKDSDTIRIQ